MKNKVQDHLFFNRSIYLIQKSYYFPLQYQPINYLFDIFQYILLPIYSFIRLIVSSFDVIHTIGFYSLGIKIDAIPGKINSTTTLRLLIKGEYRGKCFELCGQGHLLMMNSTIVYLLVLFYTSYLLCIDSFITLTFHGIAAINYTQNNEEEKIIILL